jgi:energy-converting hydrogenase Eha subunit A
MNNLIKRFPLTTLIAYGTTALAVLIVLQSSGVLTGRVAHWVDAAAGVLQVVLTAYARQHVTPLAAPKDASGRKLVPVSMSRRDAS